MAERKRDRLLRIKTVGIREWPNRVVHYNRYEATPYSALDKLFEVYKLNKNHQVVDFGCGRGRVSFYIHNRFHIPVTGIEVNEKTYEEALENKAIYEQRAKHIQAPIRFKYGLAEQYEVKDTDNCFYFFNPFSVQIFKKVLHNILKSVRKEERTVDLILYYPLPEYKHFLATNTPFELINKVWVPGDHGKYGKFLIYRYNPDQVKIS